MLAKGEKLILKKEILLIELILFFLNGSDKFGMGVISMYLGME